MDIFVLKHCTVALLSYVHLHTLNSSFRPIRVLHLGWVTMLSVYMIWYVAEPIGSTLVLCASTRRLFTIIESFQHTRIWTCFWQQEIVLKDAVVALVIICVHRANLRSIVLL